MTVCQKHRFDNPESCQASDMSFGMTSWPREPLSWPREESQSSGRDSTIATNIATRQLFQQKNWHNKSPSWCASTPIVLTELNCTACIASKTWLLLHFMLLPSQKCWFSQYSCLSVPDNKGFFASDLGSHCANFILQVATEIQELQYTEDHPHPQ